MVDLSKMVPVSEMQVFELNYEQRELEGFVQFFNNRIDEIILEKTKKRCGFIANDVISFKGSESVVKIKEFKHSLVFFSRRNSDGTWSDKCSAAYVTDDMLPAKILIEAGTQS